MISIIIAGAAFIVIVAVVVGIVDSIQAPAWRQIARERRQNWEARQYAPPRQYETHGPAPRDPWDE